MVNGRVRFSLDPIHLLSDRGTGAVGGGILEIVGLWGKKFSTKQKRDYMFRVDDLARG